MLELTERQKEYGLSLIPATYHLNLELGNCIVGIFSLEPDKRLPFVADFICDVIDAFIKSSVFAAYASEYCRNEGWKDADGN